MKIDNLRRDYKMGSLDIKDLYDAPMPLFINWLQEAIDCGLSEPTAMTLATVSLKNQPSQRMVLLKSVDKHGFVFYTNLDSRKSNEIADNPLVSLHFSWLGLDRQVVVCGQAEQVSRIDTLKYFLSRPRGSQLAAWASEQSRSLSSKDVLLQQFDAMKRKYSQGEIPLPNFWGGFNVKPHRIEFWQGGPSRLHDRFEYKFIDDCSWSIERLAP